ncbi:MAG: PQQ-like beta-propeller repeat protein [Bacteroidales bacterium]|nr:PQQ-like beta-propeller repeat protein [Bacteroidales bacterium]
MNFRFAAVAAVAFAASANAQDWSVNFEGDAKSIFFNTYTQTPILETSQKYYGLDAEGHKELWSIDISKRNAALKAVSVASKLAGQKNNVASGFIDLDYQELDDTHFARVNDMVIDVTTGQVIIGNEGSEFKKLENYDIIPSLNIILVKVQTETSVVLHCVDIAANKVIWSSTIAEASNGKNVAKAIFASQGLTFEIKRMAPRLCSTGDIVYAHANDLYLIDVKNGSVKWKNECKPGMIINSSDNKYILVVERAGGLSSKSFSENVMCIDAQTGKNVWAKQLELGGDFVDYAIVSNDQVALACDESVMLYDIKTADKLWKKPFKEDIREIELTAEGIKAYYGNKIMLVNTSTGEKVWKKPVEMDGIDEEDIKSLYIKEYANSWIALSNSKLAVYNNADNKKKWSFSLSDKDRVAFDENHNKIVIVSGKKIYVIDPDNDAKSPKPAEAKIDSPKEIVGYNVGENGYFIYGLKEYVMVNNDKTIAAQKVYPQVKTGRALNVALNLYAAGKAIGSTTFVDGNGNDVAGVFCDVDQAKANRVASDNSIELARQLKANNKLKKGVRSGENNALFFTSEKGGKVAIAVVDKNTGKELREVEFSKDPAVIYEIDTNANVIYYIDNGKICAKKL